MRVMLLTGCAQQALDAEINAATIRGAAQRHGCDVVIADGAGCCKVRGRCIWGAKREGRALARNNVAT